MKITTSLNPAKKPENRKYKFFPTQRGVDSLRACFPTARSTDRTLGRTVLFGRCDSPRAPKPKNAQAVDPPLRMWFFRFTDCTQDKYSPPEPPIPISPQPLGGLHQNLGPSFGINHPSIIRAIGAAPSPSPWSLYAANSNKSPRGKKHLPPTPSAPLPFHCHSVGTAPFPLPRSLRAATLNESLLRKKFSSPTSTVPLPFHRHGLFVPPPPTNRRCEKNARCLHRVMGKALPRRELT